MELAKLDRRGMAEAAQFLHFKDPDTGALMYSGETPIGARVRGSHARSVQSAWNAKNKDALQALTPARQTPEEIQADLVQSAALVTTEITGVTIDGAPLTAEHFERFYDSTFFDMEATEASRKKRPGSYAQQALRFAKDATNFLTDA